MLRRNRDYASKQLNKIRNRIQLAAKSANRDDSEITLIGASKRQKPELIRAFSEAGLRAVGENYLQEAINKQQQLTDIELQWHHIGAVQSNTTRLIAEHFSWVHGVDRFKIAQRLADASNALQLCVQLNVEGEASKGGVSVNAAAELCAQIAELDSIKLRGFMLIPKPRADPTDQRRPFALARETLEQVNQRYGLQMDTLSMGMSGDLEAAIAEGSTMVRIGTDLFGPRE